jgi:hypothetical protein
MPTATPPTQADWNGVYDQTQKVLLNNLFSKHVDERGNLNEQGFYKDASAAGLSPEQISTAMNYALAQKQNDLGQVQTNQMLGLYGADPNAGGRNGATIGAPVKPPIQMIPNPDAQTTGTQGTQPPQQNANTQSSRNGSSAGSTGTGTTNQSAAPVNPLVAAAPVTPDPSATSATAQPSPNPINSFGDFYAQLKAQSDAAKQKLGLNQPTDSVMNANGTTQAPTPAPAVPVVVPDNNARLMQLLGMNQTQQPIPPSTANANGQDLGSSQLTGSVPGTDTSGSFSLPDANIPPPATIPYQPPTVPDTRSATQRVVDSVDPSKSIFNIGNSNYTAALPDSLKVGASTPDAMKTSIATALVQKHYDNDGTDASINSALSQFMQDKIKAVGPAPVMVPGMTMTDYWNAQRAWIGKVQSVGLEIHNDLGSQYADQFTRSVDASKNNRSEADQQNDVATRNAQLQGIAKLVANTSNLKDYNGQPIGKALDPTTFGSAKDAQDFSERATAYSKLGNLPPGAGAAEVLAWAKNFGQAEGLSATEGTQNILTMLGAPDMAARLKLALANGAKLDGNTLLGTGALSALNKMSPENIAQIKKQMKFTSDWKNHVGGNGTPVLGTGGQQITPLQQKLVPTVNTQADYDALPLGTPYVDSQGNRGIKRGGK